MSKTPSPESIARDLSRQLEEEQEAHKQTRAQLQQEINRVWRLVPAHYINLMGVYPPLRKLLHVLAEAADLQDPSRGAPIEDTMRTQFVHTGDRASTSMTESASEHGHYRQKVKDFRLGVRVTADDIESYIDRKLSDLGYRSGNSLGISEWEYELPERPVCYRKHWKKIGDEWLPCPKRGVKQSYVAWVRGCAGCGRVFEKEKVG